MEFEDLSEEVKWQCRHVALAFGVEEWVRTPSYNVYANFEGRVQGVLVDWSIQQDTARLDGFAVESAVGEGVGYVSVSNYGPNAWGWQDEVSHAEDPNVNEVMANGLYCLGIESEDIWDNLGVTPTAHEKLELRLSMPREFWPQKWLDEEE